MLLSRHIEVGVVTQQGRSNKAVAERLEITQGVVQKHVSTIFDKPGLRAGESDDRRVLAVLACVLPEAFGRPHR